MFIFFFILVKFKIHRDNNYDGKVFLHKLDVNSEIKKEFIEKFDFSVVGDQLGLYPEVEVE